MLDPMENIQFVPCRKKYILDTATNMWYEYINTSAGRLRGQRTDIY